MSIFSIQLQKYFWGMSFIFVAVLLTVSIKTFRQTPVFAVNTSVIIRYGADQITPERGESSSLDPCIGSTTTALEILKGNVLLKKVIKAVGGQRLFPDSLQDVPSLLSQLQQRLSMVSVSATRIIKISLQHQEPEVAVAALEALLRLFSEQYRDILEEPQASLLNKQLLLYGKEMEQAEQKYTIFKKKNRIYPSKGYQGRVLADQAQMKAQLVLEIEKLREFTAALAILRQHYLDTADPAEAEDNTALIDLKLYEYELLRKYEEDDPLIASVREQITLFKGTEQRKNFDAGIDQIVQATVEKNRQQQQEAAVRFKIGQLDNELRLLVDQKKMLKALQSEVEKSQGRHALQLNKIAERMTTVQRYVTVIEQPVIPAQPVKPKKLHNIFLAALFGLLCSLVYAVIRHYSEGRGRNQE